MKFIIACLFLVAVLAQKPIPGFRAPSVPLIVMDPYMSIWSHADHLYDEWTSHWTGSIMAMYGMIRVDGKVFRWMGHYNVQSNLDVFDQKSVTTYPTRTVYVFEKNGVELTVSFSTPSFIEKKEYLMLPFTYIDYSVRSTDGQEHEVSVYYDNSGEIPSAYGDHKVDWYIEKVDNYDVITMGEVDQQPLRDRNDRISWGRLFIATESDESVQLATLPDVVIRNAFLNNTAYPENDFNYRNVNDNWPVISMTFNFGKVGSTVVSKYMIFAYDDIKSMNYFGTEMIPLWRHYYEDMYTLLRKVAIPQKEEIVKMCITYDEYLMNKIYKDIDNDEYVTVTALVYRQVTGGCKWVWNPVEEKEWIFMKEISSDGDISTIDVIYPAYPIFHYLAPDVFQTMLLPLLEYSNNEAPKYGVHIEYNLEWAPHHLGVWPICDTKEDQQEHMPVEETGNMLQLILAVAQKTHDLDYLDKYWPLLKKWADYLVKFLPDPGDQLCTDDFMGPSPHNINLAIKGFVGLAAYVDLLKMKGDLEQADVYAHICKDYYRWFKFNGYTDTHSRLQYNLPDSWSIKYNMIFQRVIDTHTFSDEDLQAEIDYYMKEHLNDFGIPLDNRATFTKADWMMWVAAMGSRDQFNQICHAFYRYANETNGRMPISDWFFTLNGDVKGFRARPVMGGIYMPLLALKQ
ncbi:hypothetical protein WA158_005174 [Blastocystis sp. Blastoise]